MPHETHRRALALVAVTMVACAAPGDDADDSVAAATGALRGRLVTYVADFPDGHSEETHALRLADDGEERRLSFSAPAGLEPGTLVDVWGATDGDVIRVDRIAAVDEAGPIAQPLTAGAPLRPRKFAFVLVDIGGGVNVTKEAALQKLTGTGATDLSVREYYSEASYGRQDISAEVFGPFKYTMNGCDTTGLRNAVRPMVPDGFDHYLWYMGSRASSCAWTGLASTGTAAMPSRDTWYNASTNCVVLVQEPGHNFGMRHSSSMLKCVDPATNTAKSFLDLPNMACQHNEYGDRYDPMGSACGHMNGYQKAYQGWLSGCNIVDVNSSGTFTLLPIEVGCNGVQLLQIKMPKLRPFYRSGGGGPAQTVNLSHYYVELRAPLGFDTKATPTPQVQIRVSNDIRAMNQGGLNTWFLDMNPATTALDGLAAGGTFTDPDPTSGIKITVESLDKTKATVRVEMPNGSGATTCTDGTALPLPGPGPESCNAAVSRPNGPAPLPNDAGVGTPASMGAAGATVPARDAGAPTAGPDAAGAMGGGGEPGAAGSEGTTQAGGHAGEPKGGGAAGTGGGAGGAAGAMHEAGGTVHGSVGCSFGGGARGNAFMLALVTLIAARRRRIR